MALNSVCIGNFKGISATQQIPIKPITIFIGPNSSGKSSTIHALAALAQTVNLPNNTRPLILDDQYAYVHLGRFIEIIHSKKYTDTITIGISGGQARVHLPTRSGFSTIAGEPSATYIFGSTRRTQDIFLKSGDIRLAEHAFALRRQKNGRLTLATGSAGRPVR